MITMGECRSQLKVFPWEAKKKEKKNDAEEKRKRGGLSKKWSVVRTGMR